MGFVSLQQFAGGEVANQSSIRGEEIVAGEVFEAYPADLLVDLVIDFAGELVDGKELQVDGTAMTVVVTDASNRTANGGLYAELFVQFAGQCLLRAFAGLDFSTRKLPQRRHRLIGAALTDQNLSATYNQGSRHKAEGRAIWPRTCIGLVFFHASSVSEMNDF